MGDNQALIFGASGVSGWSFVNEILHDYPRKGVWSKVHALTNRPIIQENTLWPKDDRLKIVSGIDLLKGSQTDLKEVLKNKIPDVQDATHVYYLAYKANTDLEQEYKDAVDMFKRAITAMDDLSKKLKFVVLQTGVKMYGCHLLENHPTDYIHVPLREDMPRLKQPYYDQLFYHGQLDWIEEFAAHKSWSWCDTRPDIIIGFHPTPNFYSLAQVLGIYFSLYSAVYGENALCVFPGSEKSWVAKSIDSSSDMIARQTIHLSLTLSEDKKGQSYNVADAKHPETWESKWPQLCQYFGLVGVGPNSDKKGLEVRRFIKDHLAEWKELEKKHELKSGFVHSPIVYPGFEYFLLTLFDFDRQVDMSKLYDQAKFEEERTVMQAWGGVWDRMKRLQIIP